ncbi:bifunctional phosphopantothenoylcysteine decarboxylase/phosphopantothenate--cysteine ligase CoaBC [Thioalkalivibrio sp. XN279]|uniref:bifunctional phosphopantothenoylcysteine decarboxylase/phosphopantothenate--cysteine ligase CoaBC n=1 Tax=Thioalkalivibrio sp. XN279 TaxID=2714953 RepID=UPI0014080299|nr:bifunctional phosphopantothenoylcysteine decarboxylase/phosphopantothenate--cysteine ligase CoaBC [Thioalkalivibrio sp. XN279]NHA15673.1 bifunctional phosphopantothenoylcysteine decarboxylase/phosphopantothenate--cysteine ligase CoaBC [Thioalkalivibrio sp. XN279]
MGSLAGKQVLLGVTGGIAAYKAPDLVRRLREQGAEVRVVMTPAAARFVTPLTFQAVSGNPVRDSLWDEAAEAAMGHIELARWADLVLVAPATADFLARLAAGMADDLLTTLCLATEAPLWVAPAMNRQMWANPATQDNIVRLQARGLRVLGPAEGAQACGETGAGRMLEPVEIVAALQGAPTPAEGAMAGRKVMVTAGPTREALDPVRYLTNRSSGKMGYAVARAALEAGAEVVLVSGPVDLPSPPGARVIRVETAAQMRAAVQGELAGTDVFVAAAAVADYRPAQVAASKIKKQADEMQLELLRNPDILAEVAAAAPRPFVVGFAAETNDVEANARKKLEGKRLDMIAANRVGADCGFDREDNALRVLWPGGGEDLGSGAKAGLARRLVEIIAERMRAGHQAENS